VIEEVLSDTEERMKKSIESTKRELAGVRTGRANPALVEHMMVDYYGTPTPLSQIATISAPEARLLVIQPWDRQAMGEIQKAIQKSDLGINPSNDGTLIRLAIPQLTGERRQELVRLVKRRIEEGRVSLRNIRRDNIDELRAMERRKDISEDEEKRAADSLQKLTDSYVNQMDQLGRAKEAEVMEV
jgi:ribosome recycling factor